MKESLNKTLQESKIKETEAQPVLSQPTIVQSQSRSGAKVAVAGEVNALAVPANSDIQGDFKSSDFKIPKLQVIQSVGPTKGKFPKNEGYFLLNGEVLLTSPEVPLLLTVIRFQKRYIENLPYDETNMGQAQIVETEKEVFDKGGTLNWTDRTNPTTGKDESVEPTWTPVGTALCVIEAPNSLKDDPNFCYPFQDKNYALAVWTLTKTAYKSSAISIITASRFALKPANGGLAAGLWEATTKYEKRGENFVHVPYLRQKGRNSAEFQAFCAELRAV